MDNKLYVVKVRAKKEETLILGLSVDIKTTLRKLRGDFSVTRVKTCSHDYIDWQVVYEDLNSRFKDKLVKVKEVFQYHYPLEIKQDLVNYIENFISLHPVPEKLPKEGVPIPDSFISLDILDGSYYLEWCDKEATYKVVRYSKTGKHTYPRVHRLGTVNLNNRNGYWCVLVKDLEDFALHDKPLPPWQTYGQKYAELSGIVDPFNYASNNPVFIKQLRVGSIQDERFYVQIIDDKHQLFYKHYESVEGGILKERFSYFSNLNKDYVKWTPKQIHTTKVIIDIPT